MSSTSTPEERLAKVEKEIEDLRKALVELAKNQVSATGQVKAQFERTAKQLQKKR